MEWRTLLFPLNVTFVSWGVCHTQCCSQKSQVIVETCAPILMRAITQMSSTKISASFTLPINSMVAFGLGDGGLGTMLVGWGLAPALVQVLCLVQVLEGGSAVSPLQRVKRSCISGARALMLHMPPNLGNYSIGSGFGHSSPGLSLIILGCITVSAVALPLGSLAACTGTFDCSFSDPDWISVVMGLFGALWTPLTATISCCGISTHFDQGSWV